MAMLRAKSLSRDDCNILWTDIVVKFALLVRTGKYNHQDKMVGFIKNLGHFMALNYLRDNKKSRITDSVDDIYYEPVAKSASLYHRELKELLEDQLVIVGKTCKDILYMWANGYSMQEIMTKLELVSLEATRKRKHICLKKLLANINNNSQMKSILDDYRNDLYN